MPEMQNYDCLLTKHFWNKRHSWNKFREKIFVKLYIRDIIYSWIWIFVKLDSWKVDSWNTFREIGGVPTKYPGQKIPGDKNSRSKISRRQNFLVKFKPGCCGKDDLYNLFFIELITRNCSWGRCAPTPPAQPLTQNDIVKNESHERAGGGAAPPPNK